MSANVRITPDSQSTNKNAVSKEMTADIETIVKEVIKTLESGKDKAKTQEEKSLSVIEVGKLSSAEPNLVQFGKYGEELGFPSVINYNLPGSTRFEGRTIHNVGVPMSFFDETRALHIASKEEQAALEKLAQGWQEQQEAIKRKAEEEAAAKLKAERDAESRGQAAIQSRERAYNDYKAGVIAGNESMKNAYKTAKSSIPGDLESKANSIRREVDTFINFLNNINGYWNPSYGEWWGNPTYDEVKRLITPQASPLQDYARSLSSSNISGYSSALMTVDSSLSAIKTQISNVRHHGVFDLEDTAKTTKLRGDLRGKVDAISIAISGANAKIAEWNNLREPTYVTPQTRQEWDDANPPGGVFANTFRNLQIKDDDLALIPLHLRRIAVNRLFPNVDKSNESMRAIQQWVNNPGSVDRVFLSTVYPDGQSAPGRPEAEKLEFWRNKGYKAKIVKGLSGEYYFEFVQSTTAEINPMIWLIETYAISNFLGNYGAGRTLNTFTLLPGERTKITIKTYSRIETKKTEASSIFDSASESATASFEGSMENENKVKSEFKNVLDASLELTGEVTLFQNSFETTAKISNNLTLGREDFARAVSKVTQNQSSEKSNKRDVTVSKSSESTKLVENEEGLEREISNPNLSRVLNFVFRQLNQEYVSLVHLIDVKIAYANGFPDDFQEVPLHQIDALLRLVLKDGSIKPGEFGYDKEYPDMTYVQFVKDEIFKALRRVSDYNNLTFNTIEEIMDPIDPTLHTGQYRFRKQPYRKYCEQLVKFDGSDTTELYKKFPDLKLGLDHGVEGIIISKTNVIMATDAVIVEALLGQGLALDGYALGIQESDLRGKFLENDRMQLALDIIRQKNLTPEQAKLAADLYYKIFGLTPMKTFAERTYPVIFPEYKKTVQNLSVE